MSYEPLTGRLKLIAHAIAALAEEAFRKGMCLLIKQGKTTDAWN
jgi:hypothetical protein